MVRCEHCEKVLDVLDMLVLSKAGEPIRATCKKCFAEQYTKCFECGEHFDYDTMHIVRTRRGNTIPMGSYLVCEKCFEKCKKCKGCGKHSPRRIMFQCESDNERRQYICETCKAEYHICSVSHLFARDDSFSFGRNYCNDCAVDRGEDLIPASATPIDTDLLSSRSTRNPLSAQEQVDASRVHFRKDSETMRVMSDPNSEI